MLRVLKVDKVLLEHKAFRVLLDLLVVLILKFYSIVVVLLLVMLDSHSTHLLMLSLLAINTVSMLDHSQKHKGML